jgi:hypothetical protein
MTEIDGQQTISAADFALLVGVSEAEMHAEMARQGAPDEGEWVFVMPKHWIRQAKETSARLGIDDVHQVIALLRTEREQS